MNLINKSLKFYTRYKRRIDPHLAFLGAYLTAKFVLRRANAILSTLSLPKVDIINRYGRGSYALITGGAGGIGKEFALDLAKKGFNLILVDFNQVNLESTQQEILKINCDLIIKIIHLDFSKGSTPDFYLKFQQEVSSLDIAILINNVGTGNGGFGIFHRMQNQNVIGAFNINLIAPILVTHAVINQMLLRDKYQSLILNLSSASSYTPSPYFFGYGASKIATANFFEALALELKDNKNIDVLTLKPFYVSTALIDHEKGFFIIQPQQLVQETWKYVGRVNDVTPHWKYQLYKYLIEALPKCISNKIQQLKHQAKAQRVTQRQELLQ